MSSQEALCPPDTTDSIGDDAMVVLDPNSLTVSTLIPEVTVSYNNQQQKVDDQPDMDVEMLMAQMVNADVINRQVYEEPKETPGQIRRKHSFASVHSFTEEVKEDIYTIKANLKKVPTVISMKSFRDRVQKAPIIAPYTMFNFISTLVAIVFYILDYVSDIMVAIYLHKEDDTHWWFILTLILIFIPLFIVNLFSIVWFHLDHQCQSGGVCPRHSHFTNFERFGMIITHVLCLGPIVRQFHIAYCGFKERAHREHEHNRRNVLGPYCINQAVYKKNPRLKDYYSVRKYYERDSAYLGMIEAFIQDGPQLMLQIYILLVRDPDHKLEHTSTAVFQAVSVLMSLISLSWSTVSYVQANLFANPEKLNLSLAGQFFQFLWRFFIMASRVACLCLFATEFNREVFIFIGLHWLLMVAWILMMGTDFCGSYDNTRRPLMEIVYDIVMGWVMVFDFIHLKEGPTRLKMFLYYTIILLETIALMTIWYLQLTNHFSDHDDPIVWSQEPWYRISAISAVPGCFIIGLSFMGVYYKFFHPSGPMPNLKLKARFI